MVGRRARAAAAAEGGQVLRPRVERRDQRREQRDEHEDRDEDEADDRARVPTQARERVAPEPARCLELDLACLELGDRHLREPDPRVEVGVRDVDEQVHQHEDDGDEEDPAL